MRKLAPMFIMTSLIAFAGGSAFAANTGETTSTDKNGQPTVSKNTPNPQGMSYGDKSSTSPGTNAKMGEKPVAMWNGVSTDCATIVAMDDSKWNAKRKHDYAMAKTECTNAMSAPTAPAASTNASKVNSTNGTSGK